MLILHNLMSHFVTSSFYYLYSNTICGQFFWPQKPYFISLFNHIISKLVRSHFATSQEYLELDVIFLTSRYSYYHNYFSWGRKNRPHEIINLYLSHAQHIREVTIWHHTNNYVYSFLIKFTLSMFTFKVTFCDL